VLVNFIEEDIKKEDDSRCAYIYQFYQHEVEPKASKVKVAKDDGKLNSYNQFDYNDKDYNFENERKVKHNVPGSATNSKNLLKPRSIVYIGKLYPHC
jgi:hypothetical protein